MRIALADDSALFRQGLELLLAAAGIEVVLSARSGAELLTRIVHPLPDVVILDIRMPPTFTDEGLQTAESIRESWPKLPVLALSTYGETTFANRLLSPDPAGRGYLLKDRVDDMETLKAALTRLTHGEAVVDPQIIQQLTSKPRADTRLESLSDREREVLRLMAEGRSNSGIAADLVVSGKTVESHVASIFTKLGLLSKTSDNRRVLAVLNWLRSAR